VVWPARASRVRKSGYCPYRWWEKELSSTPCLSGQTPVAIVDQPGPESVRVPLLTSNRLGANRPVRASVVNRGALPW
jgi:hypothetical protein